MESRDAVVVLGRRHRCSHEAVPSQAARDGGGRGLDEVLGEHSDIVLFDRILLFSSVGPRNCIQANQANGGLVMWC